MQGEDRQKSGAYLFVCEHFLVIFNAAVGVSDDAITGFLCRVEVQYFLDSQNSRYEQFRPFSKNIFDVFTRKYMEKADITIIGGGVVGLTLACLLADKELAIVLVDAQPPPQAGLMSPYDKRVSAINFSAQKNFKSIGVWDAMEQQRISAYRHMRVWDAKSPAYLEFDCKEVGYDCLGYIVEQNVMRQTLWQQLQKYSNVHTYLLSEPDLVSENEKQIIVYLKNGHAIKTNLLVGADGRNSWVAKRMLSTDTQVASETTPKQISCALVTTIRTEHSHQYTAFQRFLSTGPVALLPLADTHLVSLVWSTSTEQAQHLAAMSEQAFSETLRQAIENVLGKLSVCDERVIFPLRSYQAKHYVKSRIALVGDAAHTIFPLAGQGLNLGLLDAACLTRIISWALKNNRDIGTMDTLRRYELWRKAENTVMKKAMEGFQALFSSTTEFARCTRYLGFALTHKFPKAKKFFIQHAMGLHTDLPRPL